MDKIIIKDLVVFANHGVYEEEVVLGQKFEISAIMETDIRKPGLTDTLDDTINYGEVSAEITRFLTKNRYKLIEACAENLCDHLLSIYYPTLRKITLTIKKPWAPVHLPLDTVAVEITRGWHTAFIALGSNMGDKEAYLQFAVDELKKNPRMKEVTPSSFISTDPYGYTEQDSFLNGVCMVKTTLTPDEVLDECHRIEQAANRVRLIHWGPRTLDLDVLFYDQDIIASPTLNVPHPDMKNRDFVLKPMAEIAPWWLHPIYKKTMKQMLDELMNQ